MAKEDKKHFRLLFKVWAEVEGEAIPELVLSMRTVPVPLTGRYGIEAEPDIIVGGCSRRLFIRLLFPESVPLP